MHSNLRYGTKIVKRKKNQKLAGIGIGSFIEDGRILGTQVKSATGKGKVNAYSLA